MADAPGAPLLSREQIARGVRGLGARITQDYPESSSAPRLWLVAALKGAAVFAADLARAIERDAALEFVRAASYGTGRASSGKVELLATVQADLAGEDVILVEDIVDTGRTARRLLDELAAKHPRSLRLAALLDKPSRRQVDLTIDYLGFTIEDRFVVGYGLDENERYRNLSDIRVLN